jgi:hypothetical protein
MLDNDGWPPDSELRIRKIETGLQKRRRLKKQQLFLRVLWHRLTQDMEALGTDRATRLLMVLHLQTNMNGPGQSVSWV